MYSSINYKQVRKLRKGGDRKVKGRVKGKEQ